MLNYDKIIYTGHSIQRIFERGIEPDQIEKSLVKGEIIEEYPDDKPYPSFLLLNYINDEAIHIVASFDKDNKTIYIITAYHPDKEIWDESNRNRRNQ